MQNRFFIVILFFFSSFPSVFSQLRWKKINTAFGYLPASINIYKTTDSLNGYPFIGFYIEATLKDRNLEFGTQIGNGNRFTPSHYYSQEDSPYVLVNGSFFSFESNQNLNTIVQKGKMVAYNVPSLKSNNSDSFYYPTRSAFGISKKRKPDIAWLFTDTAQRWPYAFQKRPLLAKGKKRDPDFEDLGTLDYWNWWRMQTAMGGGPVLLQKGKIFITNKEEQLFVNGENDKHPRTAMGYTKKGKLIILVIQGRFPGIAEGATLQQEAKILKDLKCIEALNLDGGGSSCLLVNGSQTILPSDKDGQRSIPAVFFIRSKKIMNIY